MSENSIVPPMGQVPMVADPFIHKQVIISSPDPPVPGPKVTSIRLAPVGHGCVIDPDVMKQFGPFPKITEMSLAFALWYLVDTADTTNGVAARSDTNSAVAKITPKG